MDEQLGIRQLRGDLAAQIRRAGAGHRVIVTVGGRPAATLGPVDTPTGHETTLAALVAAGLVAPPRRTGRVRGHGAEPVAVWTGLRLDRALREVRG